MLLVSQVAAVAAKAAITRPRGRFATYSFFPSRLLCALRTNYQYEEVEKKAVIIAVQKCTERASTLEE